MFDFLTLIHCDQITMELLNRIMIIVCILITIFITAEVFYEVHSNREGTKVKINTVINHVKKNLGLV